MNLKVSILILSLLLSINDNAQSLLNINLNIGDPAPPIKIQSWIKGTPLQRLEKNKIYVIDFWATWCIPCMQLMPHFSELAHKYGDKATFLSINIYEKKETSLAKISKLVDSMGDKMRFTIAVEQDRYMSTSWADSSRAYGIPSIFIINNGRIDWIGHPKYADSVLTRILNKSWNWNCNFKVDI